MNIKSLSCGIVTEHADLCREFYCDLFGFQVVSNTEWYIHLRSPDGKHEIGFLLPNQLTQPRSLHGDYTGRGVWINVEVDDLELAHRKALEQLEFIELNPRDEPWGERHFMVRDPAGMLVNVLKKI
ncbi:MAG: catechol 2,3-dioxygenase-like lactoylglutathione lyase family enzyme, partial [Pirellulaceae bacterium]